MSSQAVFESSIIENVCVQPCADSCAQRSLHIRITAVAHNLASLSARIKDVIDIKIPRAQVLIMIEDQTLAVRVHHCTFRVEQADTLTCRIARLAGVKTVFSELKENNARPVYAAKLRGSAGL